MNERLRRFLLRTGAMAAKETLHIRRDLRTLYLALGMPVVLLLMFGYGLNFEIDHLPIAVVDLDQTSVSREITRGLVAANELVAEKKTSDQAQAEQWLRAGQVLGIFTIPARTEHDLARGRTVTLQLLVDGKDAVIANQLLSKAESLTQAAGARLFQAGHVQAPTPVRTWIRFNPQARSAFYLVPGLTGYLLAIAAVLLTALAVASEWERGSMEQLFASPVGRLEIVLGKLLPYLGVGIMQLLLVLAAATWVFEVPIRGNLILALTAGMLFLIGMLGQGLFISVVTRNQLVATQAGALSSLLPSMLLSGFLFPIENMPRVLQWLSMIIPARYLVHAMRGIMLKGTSFSHLFSDFLALSVFAVAILTLAVLRFQRRLA